MRFFKSSVFTIKVIIIIIFCFNLNNLGFGNCRIVVIPGGNLHRLITNPKRDSDRKRLQINIEKLTHQNYSSEEEANEAIKIIASTIKSTTYYERKDIGVTPDDVIHGLAVRCGNGISTSNESTIENIDEEDRELYLFHQEEDEIKAIKNRHKNIASYHKNLKNDHKENLRKQKINKIRRDLNYKFCLLMKQKNLYFKEKNVSIRDISIQELKSLKLKKINKPHFKSTDLKKKNNKQNENLYYPIKKEPIKQSITEDTLKFVEILQSRQPISTNGGLVNDLNKELEQAWQEMQLPLNRIYNSIIEGIKDSIRDGIRDMIINSLPNFVSSPLKLFRNLKKLTTDILNITKETIDEYLYLISDPNSNVNIHEFTENYHYKINDALSTFFQNTVGLPDFKYWNNLNNNIVSLGAIGKKHLINILIIAKLDFQKHK